jgi:hypothetical protein
MNRKRSNTKKTKNNPVQKESILSPIELLRQFSKSEKKKSHSKIKFISHLLNSQLLENNHKEKLIVLISDEIENLESEHSSVKKDVEVIKRKLREISDTIGESGDGKKTDREKRQKSNSKTVHNPQKLVDLLSSFRKGGSALKYSVHSWDVGLEFKNYNTFIKNLYAEYNEISWHLKELSENLQAKCYGFLKNEEIGKNGWGYDRIKVGWSSPLIANWCVENPSRNPLERPINYSDSDKDIHFSHFEDVINHFKKEIEVRNEGDQLKKIIIEELKKAGLLNPLGEFNRPKLINLESKTFYTDVQWFRSAIALIFKEIKKRGDESEGYKDMTIEVHEDNESVMINIVHHNSFSEGSPIEIDGKLTSIGGDFLTIKNRLMNLCDWSIENKFKEGFFRLNYLCSDSNIPFKEEIDSCEGFTHLLKFYKSNL